MNALTPPFSSAELLYQAETEILENIAGLLADGNVASAGWKIEKLHRLGALNQDIEAIINRYRDAVLDGAVSEVELAAFHALTETEDLFKLAAADGATLNEVLPANADPAILTIVRVWQSSARQQMNLAMAVMLEKSGPLYVQTINRTVLQVLIGAMSPHEALVTSVREWAETGVPSIVDTRGRQWSTEAYANMAIRSNVRRVTTEVQMTRTQEYGVDLIEVSAHAGARPGCAPYQGRIFSLSGQSEEYPPFSETSYGEAAGLFGINCGHSQYPFFVGTSRQTYKPHESDAENDQVYKESQVQRRIERSIRGAKREVQVFEALGDLAAIDQAKARVRDRQAAMRTFIDETGRTRRRDREQIHD